jgi:hypothetical protein
VGKIRSFRVRDWRFLAFEASILVLVFDHAELVLTDPDARVARRAEFHQLVDDRWTCVNSMTLPSIIVSLLSSGSSSEDQA